jgi:hypothetical protein
MGGTSDRAAHENRNLFTSGPIEAEFDAENWVPESACEGNQSTTSMGVEQQNGREAMLRGRFISASESDYQ